MTSGKKMLVLSTDALWQQRHPEFTALGWRCMVVHDRDELRGKLGAGEYDFLVLDGSEGARALLEGAYTQPKASLAEIEKRHILHVLSSTKGNKAAAARILEIDTKTLYNRLKSYERLGVIGQNGSTNLQQSPGGEHAARRL